MYPLGLTSFSKHQAFQIQLQTKRRADNHWRHTELRFQNQGTHSEYFSEPEYFPGDQRQKAQPWWPRVYTLIN